MATGKRAETLEEAAYVHCSVFTEPVWSWSEELKAKIPSFDELYVRRPAASPDEEDPVTSLTARLARTPGPVKVLLTGQKGAGKSWALRHVGEELGRTLSVVPVSAADQEGVTLQDADIQDLLVLLAAGLAAWVRERHLGPPPIGDVGRLDRWVAQVRSASVDPAGDPGPDPGWGAPLADWLVRLSKLLRSDKGTRERLRTIAAEDVAEVARVLLELARTAGREIVVLFDDIDKIGTESARRIFLSQSTTLTTLPCRMVLTYPLFLNFENVFQVNLGRQRPVVLRNVKVFDSATQRIVPTSALAYFRELTGKVMDPTLVADEALELIVRNSGGIVRQFGSLLQEACRVAGFRGAAVADGAAVNAALRSLRIELQLGTQSDTIRDAMCAVRARRELPNEAAWELLDRYLVIQYVNGEPWYDVHPTLESLVDEWIQRKH